jgi:hypothetical protein
MNRMNPHTLASALAGALGAFLFLPGCIPSMLGEARAEFARDHGGCEATVVLERADLLPAGDGPTLTHSGQRAYEITGCGHHDLATCDTPGYEGSTLMPGACTTTPMCHGPGCMTDYATAAQDTFVKEHSCPSDRVTSAPISPVVPALPTPPPDVAADPARMAVWTQTNQAAIAGLEAASKDLHFLKVDGCGAQTVYACHDAQPAAPRCSAAAGATSTTAGVAANPTVR